MSRDAAGRLLEDSLGNGLTSRNTFDPRTGQLIGVRTGAGGGASVQNLAYGWDRLANLTERIDRNQDDLAEKFTYDSLNRLKRAAVTGQTPQTFQYDAIGNISSKSGVGDYTYGDGAGPHAVTATTGALTRRYDYDARGNQIRRLDASGSEVDAFSYTAFDKPRLLSRNQGQNWSSFLYDESRGVLLREDVGTGPSESSITYFVDGIYEESQTNDGEVEQRHFVRAAGQTIAIVTRKSEGEDETRYLHRDHLGSIDTITSATGAVLERLSFDAFGKRRNPDWSPASDPIESSTMKGFGGHEQLDALGLVDMGGRVYDPELGRFLTADPFVDFPESTQGLNRYSYVENNPLTFVDPSGFGLKRVFKKVGKFFQRLFTRGVLGDAIRAVGIVAGAIFCPFTFGASCAVVAGADLLALAVDAAYTVSVETGAINAPKESRLEQAISSLGSPSQGQEIQGISGSTGVRAALPDPVAGWMKAMQPGVISLDTTELTLDGAQIALGVLGLFPGVGNLADVWNALISAGRGDEAGAIADALGASDFGGQASSLANLARRFDRFRDALSLLRKGAKVNPCGCFTGHTEVWTSEGLVPIEDVEVGDRVETTDSFALGERSADMGTEVDESWRTLDLSMPDSSNPGGTVELTILRPPEWLLEVQAEVGGLVPIEVPELGLLGLARVHGIRGPPSIQPGPGRVVLMTISRDHEQLLSVALDGTDKALEVTGNHRLYSRNRGGWVEARDVRAGEQLMTPTGGARVESVRAVPGRFRVFNLEVEGEHEYYVSSAGVRAHNAAGDCIKLAKAARKKLGNLADLADSDAAQAILDRGGSGSNVREALGESLRGLKVGEIANIAADRASPLQRQAEKALKIIKQAAAKGQRRRK